MKLLERIFIAEDKTKNWIEINRVKWYSILAITGALLGTTFNLLLHGDINQGFTMASSYSFFLIVCEFALGGEGIRG